MRSRRSAFLSAAFVVLFTWPVAAQEVDLSKKMLETMQRHVTSLRAVSISSQGEESPLKLATTPVLRYSDPGGVTADGSVWVWGGSGRPSIMAGIFFNTQVGREDKWSCELLSLADGAVAVRAGAGWSWTPDKGGLVWFKLKDAPGETDRDRLRQMKEIARQFEITSFEKTGKSQLRLMVQPLTRYADEERGLLDGAIFAYAAGTNPEALLLVECRKSGSAPAWHCAFARFGANGCQAKQGDAVVWECPAIQRWDAKEPYFSKFGPIEQVFEAARAK